jgi:hypothetical protein
MDKDTEARYLGAPNYRHLLNARSNINSQGTFGAIEDVMGNVLVNNPFLANGRNKVIGSYEDIAGQSCIFFVWNEFGFHGIFRWYANRVGFPNGEIEKIYQVADPTDNCLSFEENKLITGVNLVGELLLWTDNNQEPRCINIDRANITNKAFTFNLYFDQSAFSNLTNYTINIYGPNTAIVNWSSLATTYSGRVDDFVLAANSSLSFVAIAKADSKANYAQITMLQPGNYSIDGTPSLIITPNNFYPDKSANVFSYTSLSNQLITNIKYPPFCAPKCEYIIKNPVAQQQLQLEFEPYVFNSGGGVILGGYLGIQSIISDPYNVAVAGSTNIAAQGSPFNYPPPQGHLKNNTATPITLQITISGQTIPFGSYSAWNLGFVEYIQPNNPAYTLIHQIQLASTPGLQNGPFNQTFTVTLAPGKLYAVFAFGSNTQLNLQGLGGVGGFKLTAIQTQNIVSYSKSIINTFYQFRAKYVYDDNQHSVYGAISAVPLSSDLKQDVIKIDYSDFRLSNIELACDIKKVILALTNDNGVTWYDFKELDPYEFIGQNRQIYYFDGKEGLFTIPPSEAILPFHNIPLKSKAQEFIDNRIFYGANLIGYDKVQPNMQFSVLYKTYSANNYIVQSQGKFSDAKWKRGYTGYIGIVYYDNADRKSPVIIDENNSKISIPHYTDVQTWDSAYINAAINHEPPDYAVKYQFVRTKDLSQSSYLLWIADYEFIADDLTTQASPAIASYIRFDLSNIAYYNDNFNLGSSISYTFVKGDRIKFINISSTNTFYIDNDFEIVSTVGQYTYIKNPFWSQLSVGVNPGPYVGRWIEIYSPNKNVDNNLYYEFGECFEIKEISVNGVTKKYHTGNISNQTYSPDTPAISNLLNGNVFYRYRNVPFQILNPVVSQANTVISAETPLDSTDIVWDNNGRINSDKLIEQTNNITNIIFTDQYQKVFSDYTVNGINSVQPLNTKTFNEEYGALNKMQVLNNDVLKLVFGNSYQVSIYVNQGVIRQTQGAGNLISLSDEVAGNSHIIQRTLGTINGESVIVNDEGDMFGYDENEGVVWISSGNGLIQISDRGMKSIFKNYSNQRKATGGVSETPAVYDLYHDEYIITLGNIVGGDNFEGVTIAYNKQKQGWTSYYSFVPEYYGRVRDFIVSFKDGQLWKHDANVVAKNFYGVQYPRSLTFVSNKDFPKVKDYKAMSVNGLGENDVPVIIIPPFQGYLSGMLSSLSKRFFQTLEGIQYAYFQKDKLSPGFGGNQLQALVNGRNLKGQTIEVTLVNTDSAKSSIYSADIVYFYSEHS